MGQTVTLSQPSRIAGSFEQMGQWRDEFLATALDCSVSIWQQKVPSHGRTNRSHSTFSLVRSTIPPESTCSIMEPAWVVMVDWRVAGIIDCDGCSVVGAVQ